jgi:oligopeptide transport system substrate-binding protein
MRKKFLALAVTLVLSMSTLAGCSGVFDKDTKTNNTSSGNTGSEGNGAVETTSTSAKVIRYSISNEPPTIDPQLVNSMYGATLDYHLYDGLMRNNDGTIEPACAETYELSEDGLTYTFHLRDGLKWSDGVTLTANDFVYGIQRLCDPATASPSSYMGGIVKNATKVMNGELPVSELGVKALDDSTVEITLENPAGYFLGVLSTTGYYPSRQDLVEKYGKDFAADADKAVYNGPFTLTEWKHAASLTFTKNENYWNKEVVNLSGLEISVVTDPNTALGLYESGDLDFVELPSEIVSSYPDAKSYSTGAVSFLQFNVTANELLANKNFRKAISTAIDREQYVKLATSDISKVTSRYVLPTVSGVTNTYGEEYPYEAFSTTADVAQAKEYLAAAMKELNIQNASDIKVILNTSDADSSRKSAEVIKEQVQTALGIVLEINQVPYKQLYELSSKNEFEMMATGWVPDYSDPFSYLEFFETGNGYNASLYSSADFDSYIEIAKNAIDPKTRFDALFEAEKILCDDLPMIPTDLTYKYYLINDKITDFKTYFVGTNLNYITADITE